MKSEQETNGGATPRKFDDEFRRQAVELSLRGDRTIKEVAQQLGISEWTLLKWRQLFARRPQGGVVRARTLEETEEENRQLRAENARLREREVVLKKSLGILSETPGSGMPRSKA